MAGALSESAVSAPLPDRERKRNSTYSLPTQQLHPSKLTLTRSKRQKIPRSNTLCPNESFLDGSHGRRRSTLREREIQIQGFRFRWRERGKGIPRYHLNPSITTNNIIGKSTRASTNLQTSVKSRYEMRRLNLSKNNRPLRSNRQGTARSNTLSTK